MRTILVNHMLEPPNKVTGITRFLFGMLCGLLAATDDRYILATSWTKEKLPTELNHPRLTVETQDFYRSNTVNVMHQRRTLPALMEQHGAEAEFNSNPIGAFGTRWPRIMTVHDLYLNQMPEEYSRKSVMVGTALMNVSTRSADGILVPSESTRDALAQFYPRLTSRAFVVPEAAATLAASAEGPPLVSGRYGLMVGNISPNKNVAPLVEALKSLRDRDIHVPMLHVGRDEMQIIARTTDAAHIAGAIRSRSGVSDAELANLYRHAAFFINTSLHEGFCLPVIEAQTYGAPVIVSNRSALPEVAGDGALYVDPKNVPQIASAIADLWSDDALAQDMRRRGHLNAQRFSWNKSAMALREKIETLLVAQADHAKHSGAPASRTHFA